MVTLFKKVVIDAGHGGKDPGTVGADLQEKNITLDVAKRIKSFLESRYHSIQVILTRDTDKTITLQERVDIANKAKADLFISVHVNGATNVNATGYEDYIYSGLGPTSKTISMRKTIHDSIVKVLPIRDRGKKNASFYVLKTTLMPAVLLEIGFIVGDNQHLKSNEFLTNFSLAAASGIATALNIPPSEKEVCDCIGCDSC